MKKFILTEEEKKSIRSLYGLNEQSSETVSIRGEQPYPGETNWDLVHGILSSNKLSDDLEDRVSKKLKSGSYRITDIKVSSYVSGKKIITDGTVTLVSDVNNPDIGFTSRGAIGADYENRYKENTNGLIDRLQSLFKVTPSQIRVIGPSIYEVKGTNEEYKQAFFIVSKNSQSQPNAQPNAPETIEGTTLDEFRNNVKSKTGGISIDESSVNFSYTNNVFKVSYSTGETKIAGMTLVWSDINRKELDDRIENNIEKLYPNLIRKDEWKGESGKYYYEFLILKK
jgi:hypothetical protein